MEQQKETEHHARPSSCFRQFSYNISVLPSHTQHVLAISLPLHCFYNIGVWSCTPRFTRISALLRARFFLKGLCNRLSENLRRQVVGFVHSALGLLAVKPSEALRCPLSVLYGRDYSLIL